MRLDLERREIHPAGPEKPSAVDERPQGHGGPSAVTSDGPFIPTAHRPVHPTGAERTRRPTGPVDPYGNPLRN